MWRLKAVAPMAPAEEETATIPSRTVDSGQNTPRCP